MTANLALKMRIKQLLKQRNMTAYKLEKVSGISHSTLKNILGQKVQDSKLQTVMLIASGFNMTVSEFFDSDLFNR